MNQVFQCLQYPHLETENKHDVYSGKNCMKKFCKCLTEHAMKSNDFLKNEIINERVAVIIWICKNLLYLLRRILK